jgi:hypothetical protein
MPDLNLVVRPFVATGVAPGYVVTGTDSATPPQNTKLLVGAKAAVSAKSATFSHSLSVSYYMLQRQRQRPGKYPKGTGNYTGSGAPPADGKKPGEEGDIEYVSHVRRYYGADHHSVSPGDVPVADSDPKDENPWLVDNANSWVDVEVLDEAHWKGPQGQHIILNFSAQDNAGGNPNRKTATKRITKPDDKNAFVDIDVVTEMTVLCVQTSPAPKEGKEGNPKEGHFVEQHAEQLFDRSFHFDNSSDNTARKTDVRRVKSIIIDKSLLDSGGNPPRDPEDYLAATLDPSGGGRERTGPDGKASDVTDDDTYERSDRPGHIDVEFVKTQVSTHCVKEQFWDIVHHWEWESNSELFYYLPQYKGDEPLVRGKGGIDAPWRLDPSQVIINVGWAQKRKRKRTDGKPTIPLECRDTPWEWTIHYETAIAQHDAFGDPNWGGPGNPNPPWPIFAEGYDWWEYMDCKAVPDVEWSGGKAPDQVCAAHAFVFIRLIELDSECVVSLAGCAGIYPEVTKPECFVGTTGTATSPPTQGVGSLTPPSP